MNAAPINTVIFDLGGVYFTDGAKRFIQKMEEDYSVPHEKVIDVVGRDLGNKYRTAEISPAEFWKQAKEYWDVSLDTDELAKLWLQEYVQIDETVSLINRLTKAGYEVLFLSDNAEDRVDYLEKKYQFQKNFAGGIFSHVLKTKKPDERMYQAVLNLASHPADQCVYFDDKAPYIEPAKKLGMKGIVFESPEQAEKELHDLGLTF